MFAVGKGGVGPGVQEKLDDPIVHVVAGCAQRRISARGDHVDLLTNGCVLQEKLHHAVMIPTHGFVQCSARTPVRIVCHLGGIGSPKDQCSDNVKASRITSSMQNRLRTVISVAHVRVHVHRQPALDHHQRKMRLVFPNSKVHGRLIVLQMPLKQNTGLGLKKMFDSVGLVI